MDLFQILKNLESKRNKKNTASIYREVCQSLEFIVICETSPSQ
jgi:hypothetical protein